MTDLNVLSLTGRLVKDGELKVNGTLAILNFDIAVNRSVKKDGEWKEEASFFSCILFGKIAETIYPKIVKGKVLSLTGELRQERWEDKTTGDKKSKVVIIVDKIRVFD